MASSVMANESYSARVEAALQSRSPAKALFDLAQQLKSEGMTQIEMYQVFDQYRAKHEGDSDEIKYDALLDTMDIISGWCGSHARLFDSDLLP